MSGPSSHTRAQPPRRDHALTHDDSLHRLAETMRDNENELAAGTAGEQEYTYKAQPSVALDVVDAKANKVSQIRSGYGKAFYCKALLGVVAFFCLAFCVNLGSSAIANLALKEVEVEKGVLTDHQQHILKTAQASAVAPLSVVIAMSPTELNRVKQLTVSYLSENVEGLIDEERVVYKMGLDIIKRTRIDNITVQLQATSGDKVVVRGDRAHLIMVDGTEAPVCGGDAECSSLEVHPVLQYTLCASASASFQI